MENRYASAPEHVAGMQTAELRKRFLVEDLFTEGEMKFVYSHYDRIIMAGAVPSGDALTMPTPEALHTDHFFDNREAGVINIGEDAKVTVDGTEYTLPRKGLLYIGRGTKDVTFEAPGRFYLYSAPAHTAYPTTLVGPEDGNVLELGASATSNERTLRQLLFNGDVKSCQVMMGVTTLSPGRTSSGSSRKSNGGRSELSPDSSAFCPEGCTVTGTRLLLSVSKITRLVSRPTPEIRPTSPMPSIVAQPSRMPSRSPTFSSTDWRNGLPLSANTTPVTWVRRGSSRTLFRSSSRAFFCSSCRAASFHAFIWRNSSRNCWFCS